eukprot:2422834-Amphidinium_carterae.1
MGSCEHYSIRRSQKPVANGSTSVAALMHDPMGAPSCVYLTSTPPSSKSSLNAQLDTGRKQ